MTTSILTRPTAALVTLTGLDGRTTTLVETDLDAAGDILCNGHAHSLAVALHTATGWPIIAFTANPDSALGPDGSGEDRTLPHIRHIAVLSPAGYALDGYGATPLAELEAEEGWEHFVLGDVAALRDAMAYDARRNGRVWLPEDAVACAGYVAPLLAVHTQQSR